MAYCKQCGTMLPDESAFCPSCGARGDNSQGNSGQYQYNSQTYQNPGNNSAAMDAEENKLISILCYFGLLFLIPYLTKPESPFVKFHSNQGLVLMLFVIAARIAAVIPILGWIIGIACWVFALVCFIIGIVNVCNGDMKKLPIIGEIEILK
ncbi:MAG: zinc-ribbon domain-containing protein [Oscillospiraceae bacterium]|nr:zinc-ribbon domain-containing protein [Oscillospiraceae bacterium]